MKTLKLLCGGAALALSLCANSAAFAQDEHIHHPGMEMRGDQDKSHRGHTHINAPIGVMRSHLHNKGDWMLSYRYMRMDMDGMRDGKDNFSPEEIAGNAAAFPNPNAPPAGFRVIPEEMSTDMHMLGAMVGVSDDVTLMAMGHYLDRKMDHVTFQGMAGTTRLGTFTTRSSGWGDTKLGALVRLYDDEMHHLHLNAMLSIPTGSIKEKDDVLTPMNTRPTLRLPYAMQLGSGTYDAEPGLTYSGAQGPWSWGAQYNAVIRLENENDQNYALGDHHKMTGWSGYQFTNWLNGSLRLTAETLGDIDGADPLITAPVTTADPDNYGGDFVSGSIGFSITPSHTLSGMRLGGEFTLPLYQDLNGPQMKRDYGFTLGLQYSF